MWNKRGILPGNSLDNLQIASKGLVGIRKFVVEPPFDPNVFLPHVDNLPDTPDLPQRIDQINQQLNQMKSQIRFEGQTIGPTALPQNCDAQCMIDFLINEKEQAAGLGWIDNKVVANSLDKKLEAAKDKLQSGEIKTAANILHAFIHDLQAQHRHGEEDEDKKHERGESEREDEKAKHVNDNGFYLLEPNAEYIFSKLEPAGESHDHDKDKDQDGKKPRRK